mmetsp:Transcript_25207/g.31050  ORF Transcript_25207/g.31050 Transcript_25207/m.31050 type:complete len:256 (+) Transcript_25207:90-857(+)
MSMNVRIIVFLLSTIISKSRHRTYAFSANNNDLVSNLSLHKVFLRQSSSSPWCYGLTIDPTRESNIKIAYNFLSTQVWPSARVAAFTCETHVDKKWKVCELGAGPCLPSLTLASMGVDVIATDIDELALQMAQQAASKQSLENRFQTKILDLMGDIHILDEINADLYILSDVFESGDVVKGAAKMTMKALKSDSRVWVFAQSDRAQREIYLEELKCMGAEKYCSELTWRILHKESDLIQDRLLLCDLDEVTVNYS